MKCFLNRKMRWTDKRKKEFEELTLKYIDSLYGTALKLCHDEDTAKDLVQETYLRAYRFYDKFQWGTNLKAWLLKILRNTYINRYKKEQREINLFDMADIDPVYEEFLNREAIRAYENPEDSLYQKLFAEDLERALKKLPEEFRLVVILADIEELSYREIAEIMDCPIGTVMSRLHRARKMLQKYLIDYAIDMGIVQSSVRELSDKDKVTDIKTYRKKMQSK